MVSKYSNNVSTDSVVQLQDIVDNLQNIEKSIIQINKLLSENSNILSLVQIQSYSATTNDHTALSAINVNLSKLIEFANNHAELHSSIKPLILELISIHNIKVFYRCLNNEHSTITNPALRLLTNIVSFNNGFFVDQFLETFDLSLKSLADLFFPTKTSVRLCKQGKFHLTVRHFMSRFWISLCSNASPLTRNDLLVNNKKINNNWFKFINEFDNIETIKLVIKFIDEKILMESAFRKMTKCKILGDFTLSKLVDLYEIEGVNDELNDLLIKLTTDESNGLLFHDYRTYFNNVPLQCLDNNSTFNNNGVTISIGENKFKINNKIIYNVLTLLHPWSNNIHLKLIIQILEKCSELSAPYTAFLFYSNGSHDPKLTSFYIGQTLLLTKIIQLPIPTHFTIMIKKFIENPSNSTGLTAKHLMEIICPSSLNRSSLSKGLNSQHSLIRHLSSQLIISVLQKFHKIVKILQLDGNSHYLNIINEIQDSLINLKLPDASLFVGITNDLLKSENINKLLLLNYMKIAECYHNYLDIPIQLQLQKINEVIDIDSSNNEKKMSDLQLLLFNTYLSLTTINSNSQSKWWNQTNGKNSLFTIIAKLPYDLQYIESNGNKVIDSTLIHKSIEVLTNLINDTLVFEDFKLNDNMVMYSQPWALVNTIGYVFNEIDNDARIAICSLLDETISRVVKTPYKYLDIITKQQNGRVSPFFVAFCEQAAFVDDKFKKIVDLFIKVLSVQLFLIGESLELMNLLVKEYRGFELDLQLSNYEKSIVQNNFSISNTFSIVAFTPMNELKNKLSNIVLQSDIEIIAVLDRILTITNSDYELSKVEDTLVDLISIYGNYIIQKYSQVSTDDEVSIDNCQLYNSKYWKKLMVNENEPNVIIKKKSMVMLLLNELFETFWKQSHKIKFRDSLRDIVYSMMIENKFDDNVMKCIFRYVWTLSNEQIVEMLLKGSNMKQLVNIAIEKKIKLSFEQIMQIIKNGEQCEQFSELIKDFKFTEDEILQIVELANKSSNPVLFKILENAGKLDSEILNVLCLKVNSDIVSSMEGFKFLQFLSRYEINFREVLFDIAYRKVREMIENDSFDSSLNTYLFSYRIYAATGLFREAKDLIKELINSPKVRNVASLIFSKEMTSLIFAIFKDDPIIDNWLYRAVLYITKMFAEREILNDEFYGFLKCLQEAVNVSIWKHVPKNMLNSQLEVILSKNWINDLNILKYSVWLIHSGSKNIIECTKLINIILNNEQNGMNGSIEEIKYYTAVLISMLIKMNIKSFAHSYEIISKIFKMYKGTIMASDLIIKSLFEEIENENGESWVQYVSNWDFIEEKPIGIPELIIETPGMSNSLTVTIYKEKVLETIKNINCSESSIEGLQLKNDFKSKDEDFREIQRFYKLKDLEIKESQVIIYDIEFILLLIVNNEDLFKMKEIIEVNMRALIETNLLQLVVCGLAHESKDIQKISKRIISCIVLSLDDDIKNLAKRKDKENKTNNIEELHVASFKERSAFKVLFGNLLYTYESEENIEVPKLFIMMLSYLIPVLNNPGHFLYEKAYRYILSGSKYRPYEIPLFKRVMNDFIKDEHAGGEDSDYFRELQWILDNLGDCITSNEDMKMMRKVVEELLNLVKLPSLKPSIVTKISYILKRLVRIGGGDMLIRSFGLLGLVESGESSENPFKEVAVLSTVASGKRVNEWTSGDVEPLLKRICK